MTFRISVTSEGIVEVEFFGATTFSDRAAALDALGEAGELPKPLRLLVNFLGAELRSQDDAGRLDFIAKAITHPILENSRAALVGVSHADAHPSKPPASFASSRSARSRRANRRCDGCWARCERRRSATSSSRRNNVFQRQTELAPARKDAHIRDPRRGGLACSRPSNS